MSKKFYRDVQLIKVCRKCGVEFRPKRYSEFARLGLCWKHRQEWYKEKYQKYIGYEQGANRKKMKFTAWKKWVEKNEERRRKQALESYHRNKHKYKGRKHRKTAV